jgi:hypothetical protein
MERETGIEPATNSLEGCDSTTELLPPSRSLTRLPSSARSFALRRLPEGVNGLPYWRSPIVLSDNRTPESPPDSHLGCNNRSAARSAACRQNHRRRPPSHPPRQPLQRAAQGKVGGEGRVRTSVARRRQVYSLLRLTALPPPQKLSVSPQQPRFRDSRLARSWGLCPVDFVEIRVFDAS